MAKHRIRRWFQFGVLDLLILTTIVAVGAVLWRPAKSGTNAAKPWIIGGWEEGSNSSNTLSGLSFLPDGWYVAGSLGFKSSQGRWTLGSPSGTEGVFFLDMESRRMAIRSEWGSGVIEVLNEDGSVKSRLEQQVRLEGPWYDGMPHGTWTAVEVRTAEQVAALEYRGGELIDAHDASGKRHLATLNELRKARGLSELNERDFPSKTTAEEKKP